MKSLERRNDILNSLGDCYLAFFWHNPEDIQDNIVNPLPDEIPVARAKLSLSKSVDGYRKNTSDISIDISGLQYSQMARYWGIYDAQTEGKLLYYFRLLYDVKFANGSNILVKAGNLILKEE